jgi:uncharacterized protein (UPF0262 family)
MTYHLSHIDIDGHSLASPSDQVEHERKIAIFDLLEKNYFEPFGVKELGINGPFRLAISLSDQRLVFDITLAQSQEPPRKIMLSLMPFKPLMRDYFMICDSYYEALKSATPTQIEAMDMGRRGLHNEGATLLTERLKDKIVIDHETARRLFTLIYALHLRA